MKYVYSDMTPSLKIGGDGNIKKVYDKDVILQSIRTIMATVSGERVRNPIGANLVRLLFKPMNDDLARRIRTEILDTIIKHETRVTPEAFSVIANYDGNYYDVYMRLRITGIHTPVVEHFRLRSFSGQI